MSLTSSTLAAIQKVGAAAFTADEKLRKEVGQYAERVHAAVINNPYNLGNDNLIENFKVVARLSQTLAGIESELKKVYQVASELTGDDQPIVQDLPALAAPTTVGKRGRKAKVVAAAVATKPTKTGKRGRRAAAPVVFIEQSATQENSLAPTDVVAKLRRKANKSKPEASSDTKPTRTIKKARVAKVTASPMPAKKAGSAVSSLELGGNASKLLQHLERTLNTAEFSGFSQTAVSKEIGVPLGSMAAAVKTVIASGRVIAGPRGTFKLAEVEQPAV